MYARGMSQRDISATIDDIYGFKLSAEQISKITDYVLEEQQNWQNRTLAPFYPFLFQARLRDERMRRLQHFGALDPREREQTRVDTDF